MNLPTKHDRHAIRIGDHVTLHERHASAVVEDVCAGSVCCGWMENGVHRRAWIPQDRIGNAAGPRMSGAHEPGSQAIGRASSHRAVSRLTMSRGPAGAVAGLAAGAAYIVAQVGLTLLVRGGAAVDPIARIAAILMGPDAAPPGAEFNFTVLGMAAIIHFGLALAFGQLVSALVWHRGTRAALVTGALTGIALYGVNFELIAPSAFPWFESSVASVSILDHALFGTVAAAICIALRGGSLDPVSAPVRAA